MVRPLLFQIGLCHANLSGSTHGREHVKGFTRSSGDGALGRETERVVEPLRRKPANRMSVESGAVTGHRTV